MRKLLLGAAVLTTSAMANEVPFCGENLVQKPATREICYVDGVGREKAIVVRYAKSETRYEIVGETGYYSKLSTVRLQDAHGRSSELTVYRHYVAGTYPGDGENYPVAIEGNTPDGTVIKVVELEYRKP